MFEVGSKYEFRMIEGGDEVLFWGSVVSYEHPLVKLEDTPALKSQTTSTDDGFSISIVDDPEGRPTFGAIINITSPNFISAVKQLPE
ncbi:UNVERIFIED_ORG: hypothetical protein GGD51_002494 [Rhizobium esperanzae]|uniref:hypothetical protein n=1 Tax=Rhizobium phaseoli TaxID=396 RepID=UPI0004D60CF2|nr:hypothetical protein [Rhizobium phaseoli]KEC75399.1 hypothetical protein RLPCCGM1_c0770 [Rhizobium leguminosarum bv. phaseoli CCGM1]PDS31935.1 hypothetical protein CO650_08000 [Rhizobium phaseoli]PWI54848.1 hypothetical protein B5K03_09015 [Rhizobium phaseoli]